MPRDSRSFMETVAQDYAAKQLNDCAEAGRLQADNARLSAERDALYRLIDRARATEQGEEPSRIALVLALDDAEKRCAQAMADNAALRERCAAVEKDMHVGCETCKNRLEKWDDDGKMKPVCAMCWDTSRFLNWVWRGPQPAADMPEPPAEGEGQ